MIRLTQKQEKRPLETTISLINIVFLMLIFFLVAGQLSPPLDPEVTLSSAKEAEPLPPPDALYVRADGSLFYRDEPVTAETYMAEHQATAIMVRLGADETLKADQLLEHVGNLYRAGAEKVVLVTRAHSE